MNLKSEEDSGQEFKLSYKLGLIKQMSEVSRELEGIKSIVVGRSGEINRILNVAASSESNSFENLKQ